MRALVTAAGLAVLLAGCTSTQPWATQPPAPPASSAGASATPNSSPCASDGSYLRAESVDAAMGLRALGISLINCGLTPFRVDGYPEVRALDTRGAPLDIQALDGVDAIAPGIPRRDAAPSPFTLDPGGRATAVIVWRSTYDDPRRPPVTVPLLQIATRPGRPSHLLTPEGGLDLGSTGRFGVSPWLPAPTPATSPADRLLTSPRSPDLHE